MTKPNTRSSEGMVCPSCSHTGAFHAVGTRSAMLGEDGRLDATESDWIDDTRVTCPECLYRGTVANFSTPTTPAAAKPIADNTKGWICPECSHFGDFEIVATCRSMLWDDGTPTQTELGFGWADSAHVTCPGCRHSGLVADFCEPDTP